MFSSENSAAAQFINMPHYRTFKKNFFFHFMLLLNAIHIKDVGTSSFIKSFNKRTFVSFYLIWEKNAFSGSCEIFFWTFLSSILDQIQVSLKSSDLYINISITALRGVWSVAENQSLLWKLINVFTIFPNFVHLLKASSKQADIIFIYIFIQKATGSLNCVLTHSCQSITGHPSFSIFENGRYSLSLFTFRQSGHKTDSKTHLLLNLGRLLLYLQGVQLTTTSLWQLLCYFFSQTSTIFV